MDYFALNIQFTFKNIKIVNKFKSNIKTRGYQLYMGTSGGVHRSSGFVHEGQLT